MDQWAMKARKYQHGQAQGHAHWPRRTMPAKSTPLTPAPTLGPMMESISKDSLGTSASSFVKTAVISNCRLVASYNWLDAAEPTIIVPGRPPKWTPLSQHPKLEEDSGEYFRDRNAARFPNHPLEPAIHTWLSTKRASSPKEVPDVVACSSTLGNLLRFIRGQGKAFRISVQRVDNTVFLIRRENSPRETIPDVRGYGHTFPEAYTTWEADVKGSSSHQRLIQYDFGGRDFLVRFEADGYLDVNHSPGTSFPRAPALSTSPLLLAQNSIEQLSDAFAESNVTLANPVSSPNLHINPGGSLISQTLIFDLKTRGHWKKHHNILGDELPRLWVAQIPKLVLGFHQNGVFNDIQVRDVECDVKNWERLEQKNLSHLAALVHHIIQLSHDLPDGRIELSSTGQGPLAVHQQLPDVSNVLSPEVMGKWRRSANCPEKGAPIDNLTSGADAPADIVESDSDCDGEEGLDFTFCEEGVCRYCGKCTK